MVQGCQNSLFSPKLTRLCPNTAVFFPVWTGHPMPKKQTNKMTKKQNMQNKQKTNKTPKKQKGKKNMFEDRRGCGYNQIGSAGALALATLNDARQLHTLRRAPLWAGGRAAVPQEMKGSVWITSLQGSCRAATGTAQRGLSILGGVSGQGSVPTPPFIVIGTCLLPLYTLTCLLRKKIIFFSIFFV